MSSGITNGAYVQPSCLARRGDFVGAQRLAVRGLRALLVGRAPADDGLAADQRRPVSRLARALIAGDDRVGVVAVDVRDTCQP